jgi:hypothetical protein
VTAFNFKNSRSCHIILLRRNNTQQLYSDLFNTYAWDLDTDPSVPSLRVEASSHTTCNQTKTMRVFRYRFLLVLVVATSRLPCHMSLETKKTAPTKKRRVNVDTYLPAVDSAGRREREPAGAENLFALAKSMTMRRHLPGLDRRRTTRWIQRLLYQLQRVRKQLQWGLQLHAHGLHEFKNLDQHLLLEGCEQQEISLPFSFFESEEEKKRLAAMKFLLEQDLRGLKNKTIRLADKKSVPVATAFPDAYGDLRLLRFLRKDKKQDPVSASLRYQNFLHWREENNVDEIRARVEMQPFHPPSSLITDYMPCEFDLTETALPDKSNNIPVVLNIGEWKTAAITKLILEKKISLEDFIRHWIYMFESLHRQLYLDSYRLEKMIYVDEICDLSGMRMQQFSPAFVTQVLKPWLGVTQTYYPETIKHIFFVNPPRVLSLIWKIVAPMSSPGTVAKVRMVSGFHGSVNDFVHVRHSELNLK